jgi:hypothetical protein
MTSASWSCRNLLRVDEGHRTSVVPVEDPRRTLETFVTPGDGVDMLWEGVERIVEDFEEYLYLRSPMVLAESVLWNGKETNR